MTEFFFQLGNFPALSVEEIRHLFPQFSGKLPAGSTILTGTFNEPLSSDDADLKEAWQQRFDELGGSIRAGRILARARNAEEILAQMVSFLEQKNESYPHKIQFGIALNTSGKGENSRLLKTLLIGVKKEGQKKGLSLRFINRNFQNIDAGTYFKEELFREDRSEFFLFWEDTEWILGETLAAQQVEAFAARDYGKPVRDMQVGMLPPKLALLMVNLARNPDGTLPHALWDPFCGTGTVLVEAERLGMRTFGSDFSEKMIEASRKNLQHFFPQYPKEQVFRNDVTEPLRQRILAEAIVTEGYLGPRFHQPIGFEQFRQAAEQVQPVITGFFRNFSKGWSGQNIILSLPFWRAERVGFFYLEKILETAKGFGYTVQAFSRGQKRGSLEFVRRDQVVGREIFKFVREKS